MIDINKIYTSNNYGDYKIAKCVSWREIHIEFLLTGYKAITFSSCIKNGTVKDKMLPSVYGVGFIGEGPYKSDNKGEDGKRYGTWVGILMRCYDHRYHKEKPTYIGCSVCEEWHNFQNFAKWFDSNYIEGLHVDKDIKQNGVESKIYSPETCKFVSLAENNVEAHALNYIMADPNGNIHEIYNMSEFCRGTELNVNCMTRVYRGERNHYKGWTKA